MVGHVHHGEHLSILEGPPAQALARPDDRFLGQEHVRQALVRVQQQVAALVVEQVDLARRLADDVQRRLQGVAQDFVQVLGAVHLRGDGRQRRQFVTSGAIRHGVPSSFSERSLAPSIARLGGEGKHPCAPVSSPSRVAGWGQRWYNNLAMKALTLLLLSVLATASLSGCVTLPDPEASQVLSADLVATVDAAHPAGQTFVARRPRLNGVELWLSAEAPGPAELLVELFHAADETTPLASARLAVPAGGVGRPLRVTFAPQPDPAGQGYRLRLRATAGAIQAWGRAEDAYPGGQAFAAGGPLDADLAFRLTYDYDAGAMLGDLAGLLPRLWLALPLLALLWLPGWLLLDLAGLRPRFDSGERAALAVGLSLAVTPLLLLWTSTLGLRWSRPAVLAAAVALATFAVYRLLHHRRPLQSFDSAQDRPPISNLQSPAWPLAAIFAVSLLVRLAMVRDLAAPTWVDSVHHALLTRLIVEGGALPQTYAPLVNAGTASYHTGFHSVVAAFCGLTGLAVPQAMLLLGQVLNALLVPAAYLLAKDLSGSPTAALLAALVAGLFSPMPAYYASWGRYTQLAGLLMLPAAFVLTRQVLGTRDQSSPSPLGERVGVRGRLVAETQPSPSPQPLPQGRGDSPAPLGERVRVRASGLSRCSLPPSPRERRNSPLPLGERGRG